ncbi:uncharacterized protein FOMMEDRAFT_156050 [Fomitiporia mediterranea MF3/22]|uniref:uncharacterized protein n=1 Tax=Fomitiporia mediterranea (strain MF3/22) TaxID=694068 RepID=UPI0004407382|nr:uncharacterized protein FOMMEDRAFT_156050 [Fomitiporia mediterranea MF3/22]EJD02717.1 hypothetical protein FOMMEDRAFT_156050 [Fomitiporia mediterranea MF3/22]
MYSPYWVDNNFRASRPLIPWDRLTHLHFFGHGTHDTTLYDRLFSFGGIDQFTSLESMCIELTYPPPETETIDYTVFAEAALFHILIPARMNLLHGLFTRLPQLGLIVIKTNFSYPVFRILWDNVAKSMKDEPRIVFEMKELRDQDFYENTLRDSMRTSSPKSVAAWHALIRNALEEINQLWDAEKSEVNRGGESQGESRQSAIHLSARFTPNRWGSGVRDSLCMKVNRAGESRTESRDLSMAVILPEDILLAVLEAYVSQFDTTDILSTKDQVCHFSSAVREELPFCRPARHVKQLRVLFADHSDTKRSLHGVLEPLLNLVHLAFDGNGSTIPYSFYTLTSDGTLPRLTRLSVRPSCLYSIDADRILISWEHFTHLHIFGSVSPNDSQLYRTILGQGQLMDEFSSLEMMCIDLAYPTLLEEQHLRLLFTRLKHLRQVIIKVTFSYPRFRTIWDKLARN